MRKALLLHCGLGEARNRDWLERSARDNSKLSQTGSLQKQRQLQLQAEQMPAPCSIFCLLSLLHLPGSFSSSPHTFSSPFHSAHSGSNFSPFLCSLLWQCAPWIPEIFFSQQHWDVHRAKLCQECREGRPRRSQDRRATGWGGGETGLPRILWASGRQSRAPIPQGAGLPFVNNESARNEASL